MSSKSAGGRYPDANCLRYSGSSSTSGEWVGRPQVRNVRKHSILCHLGLASMAGTKHRRGPMGAPDCVQALSLSAGRRGPCPSRITS